MSEVPRYRGVSKVHSSSFAPSAMPPVTFFNDSFLERVFQYSGTIRQGRIPNHACEVAWGGQGRKCSALSEFQIVCSHPHYSERRDNQEGGVADCVFEWVSEGGNVREGERVLCALNPKP